MRSGTSCLIVLRHAIFQYLLLMWRFYNFRKCVNPTPQAATVYALETWSQSGRDSSSHIGESPHIIKIKGSPDRGGDSHTVYWEKNQGRVWATASTVPSGPQKVHLRKQAPKPLWSQGTRGPHKRKCSGLSLTSPSLVARSGSCPIAQTNFSKTWGLGLVDALGYPVLVSKSPQGGQAPLHGLFPVSL